VGGVAGGVGGVAARPKRLKIFFDGGCRPNPGTIEAAVVARGVTYFLDDLGSGTSSDAEWQALLAALRLGQSLGEPDFELIGDCANVIAQANGEVKSRGGRAQAHLAAFWEQAASAPPTRIRWIARTQNLAGIALARRRLGFPAFQVGRNKALGQASLCHD
jgi:ribonuclease HI